MHQELMEIYELFTITAASLSDFKTKNNPKSACVSHIMGYRKCIQVRLKKKPTKLDSSLTSLN